MLSFNLVFLAGFLSVSASKKAKHNIGSNVFCDSVLITKLEIRLD